METLLLDQEEQITSIHLPLQQPEEPQTEQPVEQFAVTTEPAAEASPGSPPAEAAELQWYATEFEHHANYLKQWSAGAVTEASRATSLFAFAHSVNSNPITEELPAEWTSAEKLKFFGSIARRSRWQPDLIAQDIGTKSQADVVEYIMALERERRILKAFSKPRKLRLRRNGWINGLAPAAREMKASRVEWEEKMAEQLVAKESLCEAGISFTVDSQAHIQRLADIAKRCRMKANEMDKAPEKDLSALRPKRLELLRDTKRQLDEAVEESKYECTTRVIERILRACDINGLRVLDVVVRKAVDAKTSGSTDLPPELRIAAPATTSVPINATSSPSTISADNRLSLQMKEKESLIERHKKDVARLAYLNQFPFKELNAEEKAEKQAISKRINKREKRTKNLVILPSPPPMPSDTSHVDAAPVSEPNVAAAVASPSTTTLADTNRHIDEEREIRPNVNVYAENSTGDIAVQSHVVLDLMAYKSHRPDTFEKHAAKVAKEEYEKARTEYLDRVPRHELTEEQKREKKILKDRIQARERKRMKAAENAGLALNAISPAMLDTPQADIRLFVLAAKKSKRKRDEDTADAETPSSKRLQRYREEQERLDYLTGLVERKMVDAPSSEECARKLTADEKKELRTLQVRIKGRKRYREQVAEELGVAMKREVESQSASTSQQDHEDGSKTPSLSLPMQDGENAAKSETVLDQETAQKAKRKMGRPRKLCTEEKDQEHMSEAEPGGGGKQQIFKVSLDRPIGESRRSNQFDDNGVGVTYFRLDLKRHYDSKVDEMTAFIHTFNVEFEIKFRALLKNDHNAVGKLLKEFRYTPQLFAFAIRRRMELLDSQHLINLLGRTQSETDAPLIDLTQILDSLDLIAENIRRCSELCIELTNDVLLPDTQSRAVTADIASLALSMVPKQAPPKEVTAGSDDLATKPDTTTYRPRVPDADWVDMVDPSDGLFEEDPLAEEDEDLVADDDRLDEVDRQQDVIDTLEDEEYEERLERASRHPSDIGMKSTAIPVLEHDVFDWLTYEWSKQSRWVQQQKRIRNAMLPEAWVPVDLADSTSSDLTLASKDSKRDVEELRKALRATIYHHDMLRWQRIKRLRDPMYKFGGMQRFVDKYKSAAFIDNSDDEDSETEIDEGEDEDEEGDGGNGDDWDGGIYGDIGNHEQEENGGEARAAARALEDSEGMDGMD